MKIILSLILTILIIAAGCLSQTQPQANGTGQTIPAQPTSGKNHTIIEAPSDPVSGTVPKSSETPATSQQDCATLTSTCGACVSKPGCGWCKTTNACYFGDSSGPKDDIDCQPVEWATNEQGCKSPTTTVGTTCEQQYNCAFCLSGTGCKWCIDGSKCRPTQSTEECFGGWLTVSYQCNYASR